MKAVGVRACGCGGRLAVGAVAVLVSLLVCGCGGQGVARRTNPAALSVAAARSAAAVTVAAQAAAAQAAVARPAGAVMVDVSRLGGSGPGALDGFRAPRQRVVIDVHRVLGPDGIAGVRFGASPSAVVAGLRPLVGPPASENQSCGFDDIQWGGLGVTSSGRLFSAQLDVWVVHRRFVGYSYSYDNVWRISVPGFVKQRLMLATARGLTVGDTLARGRRLYGLAFGIDHLDYHSRYELWGLWGVAGASGTVGGEISSVPLIDGPVIDHQATWTPRRIATIDAGLQLTYPCLAP